MREIQFRGKANSGNWITGSLVYSNNIMPAIYYEVGKGASKQLDWAYVKPETVGQFTGLTDKNGKKVYEGDILSSDIYSGCYVMYCDKCKSFEVHGKHEYCYSCHHDVIWRDILDDFEVGNLEIIGNIIDNPDLVE